jgi:pseudaminic acid cytidylyltransferase
LSIAVIPARGGSKRIPRKNIKELAGKPAIAYPIQLALSSDLFERVIVTTDDQEIAKVALEYGAEVPFVRSAELSDDYSTTLDVVADAIQKLNLKDIEFLCCIYPVTPLLTISRIRQAAEILKSGSWDYVFPAIEYATPIERAFRKDLSGVIKFISPDFVSTRTQDLQKSFYDAGQFYFGRVKAWEMKAQVLNGNSTFIEMEKNEVIDIDEIQDWELASLLVQLRKN